MTAAVAVDATPSAPEGFGEWVSGGYFIGRAAPSSEVWFEGDPVAVDDRGYYLLGFDRDTAGEKTLVIEPPGGDRQRFTVDIDRRDFDVQRIDGLDPSRVEPPAEVHERIVREARQTRRARQAPVEANGWRTPFVWPAYGRISGIYGSQRILNGQAKAPHWGIDIAAPTGTPVYAPAPGRVTLAESDLYYSGGTLIVNHGAGLSSSFLHLSRLDVGVGDRVEQGQRLGAVGSTGRSIGPHLDWRINAGDRRIDAGLWVPPMDDICRPEG